MSDRFWQDLLEPEEELLWTGRPRPKLSLRNFQLFGPFVGAIGTVVAGAFVLRGNTLPVSQSVVAAVIVVVAVAVTAVGAAGVKTAKAVATGLLRVTARVENPGTEPASRALTVAGRTRPQK